jgi:NAD(P)H-dependent FMN reductase
LASRKSAIAAPCLPVVAMASARRTHAMSLHVAILYGSVREARAGIRLVRFVDAALRRRGHTTNVVDPAEYRLPLLDQMYKEYERGTAPRVLQELAEIYRRTDAFAIVSGEYNHGIPPALKNLLDHFLEEYFFRPSAIVCYSAGQFGGVRAAMQLRMTLAELGMPSIPSLLPVPRIEEAFTPAGEPTNPGFEKRSERFFREFEWYAEALREGRRSGVPY